MLKYSTTKNNEGTVEIQKINYFQLSLLLFSAASAKTFKCYTCGFQDGNFMSCPADWNADTAGTTVDCSDQNGEHCFVSQTTDGKGNKVYKRGCQKLDIYADLRSGCITKKEGEVCYEGCTSDKCNKQTNLNSSATAASVGILSSLMYMML